MFGMDDFGEKLVEKKKETALEKQQEAVEKAALKKEAAIGAKEPAREDVGGKQKEKTGGDKESQKAGPAGKKERQKPEEKKREIVLERMYTVPLDKAYRSTKWSHANYAVKILRSFASRHFKSPVEKVRLATQVNEKVRSFGTVRIPKKLKVKLTKDREGLVRVELAEAGKAAKPAKKEKAAVERK